MEQTNFKVEDLEKPVTYSGLFAYTEEFLMPKMAEMMDEKFQKSEDGLKKYMNEKVATLEYNLKDYIDKKMAEYTSDIFKRLEKRYQQDKHFKEKIVELFKKHQIGSSEDLAFLEGLVQGS